MKELYGSSSHCAAPGCDEPHYKRDHSTGGLFLNSTVAHICAASPQGPRFDPLMTPEDNRAASNLLVLCLLHSRAIDAQSDKFPVETLAQWKEDQLRQSGGSALSDDQAAEIIAASQPMTFSIAADVINVGGSWGGGGGVIGRDAVGGPGGDRIYIGLDGRTPGGGGGALTGLGRTPPDAIRAKEGRGYSYGLDGGTSSFGEKGSAIYIEARGGAAAGSPYEIRRVTDGLRLSILAACNSVEIRDEFLYILGGAWQSVSILNIPSEVHLALVVVIEAGGVEVGHYSLEASATGPDGSPVGERSFPVVIEESGDVLRIARSVPLTMRVTSYGLHSVTVSSGDAVLGSIDLAVKRTTDAA
ncbi:MAG: hypothetical protein BGO26_20735 [Actinobacteria bacterium 69-20]|nr:MAG: hypothetical protein BGO26_20735 [Actinobacteria bacterium 69-20]